MHSLPQDPHDLVLLLIQSVTDQQPLDRGGVGGILPFDFDFGAVDTALSGFGIAGVCDATDRRIEFYPTQANVYRSLSDLLGKFCKTSPLVWYASAGNGILTYHEAKQP